MEDSAAVVAVHNPLVVTEIAEVEDNPVADTKHSDLGVLSADVAAECTLVVFGEQFQTRSIHKNLDSDCSCQ